MMFFEWLFNTEYYKRTQRLELLATDVAVRAYSLHVREQEVFSASRRMVVERREYAEIIRRKDAELHKLRRNYTVLVQAASNAGVCIVEVPCQS